MSEIARLLVVPLPVSDPLVAPVSVMSPAVSVVGSALKVRVNSVVSTEPDAPFAVRFEKMTVAGALYTTAVWGEPVIA